MRRCGQCGFLARFMSCDGGLGFSWVGLVSSWRFATRFSLRRFSQRFAIRFSQGKFSLQLAILYKV